MFIGDAGNLPFLQVIRRLVSQSVGPCMFADDPLRHLLVEATPRSRSNWIVDMVHRPPKRPQQAEAQCFLRWYLRATSCVFNLFNADELRERVPEWLEMADDGPEQQATSAIYFLILSIGAQTCPEDRDDIAEQYFNYGRFLTMAGIMEDPSISTIQANLLITMYLLGASRRNAAFVYLGLAVRATYALGIHRRDINALFGSSEYALRERVWKVVRVLDLFLSASLGRPPSTCETRDTSAEADYSASNDLCAILEDILTQVYSKRMVSTDVLERISEHHRQWAKSYTKGLAVDDIQPGDVIDTDEGKSAPNLGIYHLKEAYYWTIMLLSRPFLIQTMSRYVSEAGQPTRPDDNAESDKILAHACVDSAVRTVDVLRGLTTVDILPKRLPFVVNSLFVAALVLGLAQFGDLDRIFPIQKSLTGARSLLAILSHHDEVAKRNLSIVVNLQEACDLYQEKRARGKMERQRMLIGKLFGTIHGNTTAQNLPRENATFPEDGEGFQPLDLCPTPVSTDVNVSCHVSHNNSAGSVDESQRFMDLSDESLRIICDLGTIPGLTPSMSPRTLTFDAFDKDISLFSAVDASTLYDGSY
ncbi:hypothetical protein jhhlp_008754 [Lomentospora prolificans]|uniref:Xylanolytic transcriptional activator regulatory domain-containing protein n=1 Tax=Lomentospora prolificans TaxID=41688 RepID=A0A2N3MYX5_9PEZI|nr:hypothetical protein jhhlp_008754 [Lomentospora prolificans]